jgi:hypothetical protein
VWFRQNCAAEKAKLSNRRTSPTKFMASRRECLLPYRRYQFFIIKFISAVFLSLEVSDYGVMICKLFFWTLSIVCYKIMKTSAFRQFDSASIFRWRGGKRKKPCLLDIGPVLRLGGPTDRSSWWWRRQAPQKPQQAYTRLHGTTIQKTGTLCPPPWEPEISQSFSLI